MPRPPPLHTWEIPSSHSIGRGARAPRPIRFPYDALPSLDLFIWIRCRVPTAPDVRRRVSSRFPSDVSNPRDIFTDVSRIVVVCRSRRPTTVSAIDRVPAIGRERITWSDWRNLARPIVARRNRSVYFLSEKIRFNGRTRFESRSMKS